MPTPTSPTDALFYQVIRLCRQHPQPSDRRAREIITKAEDVKAQLGPEDSDKKVELDNIISQAKIYRHPRHWKEFTDLGIEYLLSAPKFEHLVRPADKINRVRIAGVIGTLIILVPACGLCNALTGGRQAAPSPIIIYQPTAQAAQTVVVPITFIASQPTPVPPTPILVNDLPTPIIIEPTLVPPEIPTPTLVPLVAPEDPTAIFPISTDTPGPPDTPFDIITETAAPTETPIIIVTDTPTPTATPTPIPMCVTQDKSSPPSAAPYYLNNFRKPLGPEWIGVLQTFSDNGYYGIGPMGNTTVTFTQENLPPHTTVQITFDLAIIGSWDGYPDLLQIDPVGAPDRFFATFSNTSSRQSFPGTIDPKKSVNEPYPGTTGGKTDVLEMGGPGYPYRNTIYKLACTWDDDSDPFSVNFSSQEIDDAKILDERWSIANFKIWLK